MFRTDVPTAAGTLPTPTAPGTPGFFTDGNPALGIPATVVDNDWLNRMQEELMSVLQAASITPVKSNNSQLLRAILACSLLNDVGVVNVLVANPLPAFTSLIIGTEMILVPAITNTGTATLNVSSLGALSVLRPDGTVVQAGDLPAGRRMPIIYDGTAWRLLNWPSRASVLSQALTLYCNQQTGNDANTGLTTGTAFATLNGVYNWLYLNADVTGQTVTVQCSGNFTSGLLATQPIVGAIVPSSIVFNFAAGTTISITNGAAFQAFNPGVGYSVTGPVTISATGGGSNQGCGFIAANGGQITWSGVTFGACTQSHVLVSGFGVCGATGNYTIAGNAAIHINDTGGLVNISGLTITLTGTPAFSTAFLTVANSGGQVNAASVTWSGTATGARFALTLNGTLSTNGGQASVSTNYIPGNANGTQATGGQFA